MPRVRTEPAVRQDVPDQEGGAEAAVPVCRTGQRRAFPAGNRLPLRGRRLWDAAGELRRVWPGEERCGRPERQQRVDEKPGASGGRKVHVRAQPGKFDHRDVEPEPEPEPTWPDKQQRKWQDAGSDVI